MNVTEIIESKKMDLCKLSLDKIMSQYKNPLNSYLGKQAKILIREGMNMKYVKVYTKDGKVFTSSFKKYNFILETNVLINKIKEFRVLLQKNNKMYIQVIRYNNKTERYEIDYEFEKLDNDAAHLIRPYEIKLDPKRNSKYIEDNKVYFIDPNVRKVKGNKVNVKDADLQIIGGYLTWKDMNVREDKNNTSRIQNITNVKEEYGQSILHEFDH